MWKEIPCSAFRVTLNFRKVKVAMNLMKINELYQEKPRLENNPTITLKYFISVHCKKEKFIYIEKQLLIKNNATNISTGKKSCLLTYNI